MTEPSPISNPTRTTSRDPVSDSDRPFRGRRITWAEFRKLMDEVANDDRRREEAA